MPHKDPSIRKKYIADYNRNRYNQDPDFKKEHIKRVRLTDKKRSTEFNLKITEFRRDGCCMCNEKTPECLVAHHTDPKTKDFNIGDMRRQKLKVSLLEEELKKCICLCMNCHAKVHSGLIKLHNFE